MSQPGSSTSTYTKTEFEADIRNPAKTSESVLKTKALQYEVNGKKVALHEPRFTDGEVPFEGAVPCKGCKKISLEANVPGIGQKEIGYVSFTESSYSPGAYKIGMIEVDEIARGQGLQDLLYKKLFEKHPEIKAIETSLDDVNHSVLQDELAKILKQQPNFKPNQNTIPENVTGQFAKKGPSTQAINECCREYINQLQTTDPKAFSKLIQQAAEKTPAWKSRVKFGFTELADFNGRATRPTDLNKVATEVYVEMIHARP